MASTAFSSLRANHPASGSNLAYSLPTEESWYLTTPDLQLRLVALPAYSPDLNADEAVWDWAREEVTANECLGTSKVQEKMNHSSAPNSPKDEVKHRSGPFTG